MAVSGDVRADDGTCAAGVDDDEFDNDEFDNDEFDNDEFVDDDFDNVSLSVGVHSGVSALPCSGWR